MLRLPHSPMLITLCLIIILPIFFWARAQTLNNSVNTTTTLRDSRLLIRNPHIVTSHNEDITIKCVEGVTCAVQIDACKVLPCDASATVMHQQRYLVCIRRPGNLARKVPLPPPHHDLTSMCWGFEEVIANTGTDLDLTPNSWQYAQDFKKRFHIYKAGVQDGKVMLGITLTNPTVQDADHVFMLAANMLGKWSMGPFLVLSPQQDPLGPLNFLGIRYLNLTSFTCKERIALETGYEDSNMWLKWVQYTATSTNNVDCVACAKARPVLGTAPFKLNNQNDPVGLRCTVNLFGSTTVPRGEICKALHYLFPPVQKPDVPPSVIVYPGNYSCFTRTGRGVNVGSMPKSYCSEDLNITGHNGGYASSEFLQHSTSRADLWWLCGDRKLRPLLPQDWAGPCAIVQLLMPFHILPVNEDDLINPFTKMLQPRHKRAAPGGSFDSHIYIDVIGVPRGVPDEFKARNQILAGFESIFLWPTVNKNVDWINYIYYNQKRFVNYTRDAVRGIVEQLGPTSLMAWQNRMALDMILAEKGGVCKMFGDFCCTFIPNNSAPDGSITKALAGLTSLSSELAENSGIEDPFGGWLDVQFGKYKALIALGGWLWLTR
uniref:Uncharacterized protein n=1 Tax=Monopterus albus TaxID=43700 RepID=A0A3Q3J8I3_MONAL